MSLLYIFHNFTFILFSVCVYSFAILILIVFFWRFNMQIMKSKTLDFSKVIIIGKHQLNLLNIILSMILVHLSLYDFKI